MGDKSKGPRRFSAPPHLLKPKDPTRINRLARKFKASGKTNAEYPLKNPTEGEMLYLSSILPDLQRPFQTGMYKVLLRELHRKAWCENNGDRFRFWVDEDSSPEMYDGQTRAAALYTFAANGGELPSVIYLFFTIDRDAYRTVDAGKGRSVTDVAVMLGRPPVSGGVRSGILYELGDFRHQPKMSAIETDERIYSNMEVVRFCRSLPQSSGDAKRLALAGLYAAAIRAWRIDPEKAFVFFTAFINLRQTLPNKDGLNVEVKQLVQGIDAIESCAEERRGQPGKVLAAYIGMQAFKYWCSNKNMPKKATKPPEGKFWPTTMPRPTPLPYVTAEEAAAE